MDFVMMLLVTCRTLPGASLGGSYLQCPRCHTENRAGHRFCGECGLSFALACPSCGFPKESNVKFCGDCGAPLAAPRLTPETRFASPESYTPSHLAEKILRSKSALEGEWKQVTVLFTDVSGFTAISSPLDPEDVHEIMDQCFDVILGAVHRYEGTINQFLGDGVMALFGAPIAHEGSSASGAPSGLRRSFPGGHVPGR